MGEKQFIKIMGGRQVELLAEALNLGDRTGVARDAVVVIVEQLFPGPIMSGTRPRLQGRSGFRDAAHVALHLGNRTGARAPHACCRSRARERPRLSLDGGGRQHHICHRASYADGTE